MVENSRQKFYKNLNMQLKDGTLVKEGVKGSSLIKDKPGSSSVSRMPASGESLKDKEEKKKI
jgi:hypothetical protein